MRHFLSLHAHNKGLSIVLEAFVCLLIDFDIEAPDFQFYIALHKDLHYATSFATVVPCLYYPVFSGDQLLPFW